MGASWQDESAAAPVEANSDRYFCNAAPWNDSEEALSGYDMSPWANGHVGLPAVPFSSQSQSQEDSDRIDGTSMLGWPDMAPAVRSNHSNLELSYSMGTPTTYASRFASPRSAGSSSSSSPHLSTSEVLEGSSDSGHDSMLHDPSSSTGGIDDRRRHPCPYVDCNRRFTNRYTLKVHMAAHTARPRDPLPCSFPDCAEQFSRRHDRLRHEVTQHGKVSEWICNDCGRFFNSRQTLSNHKCPVAKGPLWSK